jgi:D-cysteine desulfhydrase
MALADLPTPLEYASLRIAGNRHPRIAIKRDDLSGLAYGGNKVRKLEYLLRRARDRGATRVATFGAVASNHALATTLYAARNGFRCVCFLGHQAKTPQASLALALHLQYGTEVVRFGGPRGQRVATLRHHLGQRDTWVIPAGGSCWLGALGFVNAGLELAAQLAASGATAPDRLYVANGTMATAAGLALGLALAGLDTAVHAIRVTENRFANREGMWRLVRKTAAMMRSLDGTVPADLADGTRLEFRDEFFGGGYAVSTPAADAALAVAREQLGLALETTYTGKALAALLEDARDPRIADRNLLFWNTYNSRPLPSVDLAATDLTRLPAEFLRYFD